MCCWNYIFPVFKSRIFNHLWCVIIIREEAIWRILILFYFIWKKMRNSVSEHSLYIESEDEDEEKVSEKGEDDGNESDLSNSSTENQQKNIPSSYNNLWPQSYRYRFFFFPPYFGVLSVLQRSFLILHFHWRKKMKGWKLMRLKSVIFNFPVSWLLKLMCLCATDLILFHNSPHDV